MRIHKISINKIEIFIDSKDLIEKNISIEKLMASSFNYNNYIFKLVEHTCNEIDFNLSNYNIVLDAFFIPINQSFLITITRIPYIVNKNIFKKYKMNISLLIKFKNFNILCKFCNYLNLKDIYSDLFYYDKYYYLNLHIKCIYNYNKIICYLNEFIQEYNINTFINENACLIVKNNAINFCRNFVV